MYKSKIFKHFIVYSCILSIVPNAYNLYDIEDVSQTLMKTHK